MKSSKTISIIIPSKNNADTIRELLISLLNQTVKPNEIIVVDSSTDNTSEIVREYPVTLIISPAKGANHARNVGVKNSTGDILVFIDGDCKAGKDWLKYIIQGFRKVNIACVGGSVKTLNLNNIIGLYGELSIFKLMPIYGNDAIITKENFSRSKKPVSANMAITRDVFAEIGDFDEKYIGGYEEFDYEQRITESGHNILCSSKAIVEHKHRETFKLLVKQYYKYGVGSGRFCRKYPFASFTMWHNMNELILFGALIAGILSIKLNIIFLLIILILPIIFMFLYYFISSLRMKNPFIISYFMVDIIRIYTFYTGQLVGRIKKL
ncbi:MAG: glycosyltransferase [Candidatus Methanoperedens sp.]|nr:glycosyltransferase [Candidatus Methanoperedens sp.]